MRKGTCLGGKRMAAQRQCKVLNVAEKNDAARELSKVMSRGRFNRREGFSKFNKIYEFDFNILGKECKMVMTSVSGHLLSLDFAPAYKNWSRTLEKEIRGCQHLVLWTDGDREGENIAEEIVHVCTQVKKTVQIHRARFSEITPQSIMRACASLGRLNQNVSDAVKVRQEVDLRIGCAFTRFQTMRLKQVFSSVLSDQLISYGPCQFPTLGFVVERYKQVQAFIPESFHKIKVVHETTEGRVEFNWKRVRVFNHTVCLILYQMCLEASRKMRINAKETMRIAEKLYTQGFISYPRTETNMFPESFDLTAIVRDQTPHPNWGGFASQLLARGVTPRQGNKTDNAHPPIHPTKYTNSLQGNEQRIYEYVVRHFLACCSQNAEGHETSVEIEVAGEGFSAQGLAITARNYLDVFPYDKWSDKTMPVYQENSTFQPSSIEMVEGETSPPSLLQEADLIALMEKHGIGTDATHAEHIETIKNRNYVGVQSDGHFVPGELGMGLVEGYDAMGYELAKPRLRAELENDLKLLDEALSKYFGPPQQVTQQVRTASSTLSGATVQTGLRASCVPREMTACTTCHLTLLHDLQFPSIRVTQNNASSSTTTGSSSGGRGRRQRGGVSPQPRDEGKRWWVVVVVRGEDREDGGGGMVVGMVMSGEVEEEGEECLLVTHQLHSPPLNQIQSRQFHKCSKRGDGGCNFFLWMDQDPHPAPLSSSLPPPPSPSPSSSVHTSGYGSMNTSCSGSSRSGPGFLSAPKRGSGRGRRGRGGGRGTAATSGGGAGMGVVCNCGQDAVMRTVQKEGPNKGRQFCTCSKPREDQCGFFEWADDVPTSNITPGLFFYLVYKKNMVW
ncbi:DNA topoisomerase 3-alpha [Geodia barretti]|uniref:DNA topoisomerase n=1 Tax=Geodia barretti TaxID=519541 RepID=A0AA35XEG6_GEOBA|nr:DNA topoisomerase 3-alpha [Geodia barretti]